MYGKYTYTHSKKGCSDEITTAGTQIGDSPLVSTESRISSIIQLAASCAAATTKSLTERPWISAARRTTERAAGVMRASIRAIRLCF